MTQFTARGMNFGQDVQETVKSGAVEVAMLRPASFWSLILAGWSGRLCIQALCLLPPAAALGFDLGGAFPSQGDYGLLVVSCIACLLCGLCIAFMIGCSTLWLDEGGPVIWISQKLTLILGGMLCPIVFYPHWLQSVAWATPFPAFAAITGGFALNRDPAQNAVALGLQIVWTGLMLAGCAGLTHLMHRKIARPA
jgi:ABC-2 type transport system permease protein